MPFCRNLRISQTARSSTSSQSASTATDNNDLESASSIVPQIGRSRRRQRSPISDAGLSQIEGAGRRTRRMRFDQEPASSSSSSPLQDLTGPSQDSLEAIEDAGDFGFRLNQPRRSARLARRRLASTAASVGESTVPRFVPLSSHSASSRTRRQIPLSYLGPGEHQSAVDRSQDVLRQSLETVLANVLRQQSHIQQSTTPNPHYSEQETATVDYSSFHVQMFYFIGTFNVEIVVDDRRQQQRPPQATRSGSNNDFALSPAMEIDFSHLRSENYERSDSSSSDQVQQEWISRNIMRSTISTPTNSSPTDNSTNNNLNTQRQIIELPVVMLGSRNGNGAADRGSNGSGWIMYVIGGGATSRAIQRVSQSVVDRMFDMSLEDIRCGSYPIPRIVGTNGRLLSVVRPDTSTRTEAERLLSTSFGSVGIPLNSRRSEQSTAHDSDEDESENDSFLNDFFSDSATVSTAPISGSLSLDQNNNTPIPVGLGVLLAAILSRIHESTESTNSISLLEQILTGRHSFEGSTNGDSYEMFSRLAEVLGPAIPRHVPVEAIDRSLNSVSYKTHCDTHDTLPIDTRCPICLAEYQNEDFIRELPCKHFFHKECVDYWLSKHVNNCPLCRNLAIKQET